MWKLEHRQAADRSGLPSDLTDAEWAIVEIRLVCQLLPSAVDNTRSSRHRVGCSRRRNTFFLTTAVTRTLVMHPPLECPSIEPET
jgi:protein involved in temperature-dependent protein secretion